MTAVPPRSKIQARAAGIRARKIQAEYELPLPWQPDGPPAMEVLAVPDDGAGDLIRQAAAAPDWREEFWAVLGEPLGLSGDQLPGYDQVPDGCCLTCHRGPLYAPRGYASSLCLYCQSLATLRKETPPADWRDEACSASVPCRPECRPRHPHPRPALVLAAGAGIVALAVWEPVLLSVLAAVVLCFLLAGLARRRR